MILRRLLCVVALAAALVSMAAPAGASERPDDDRLIQALQQGGLVIAFGHAAPAETPSFTCAPGSISPRLRLDAEQVGEAFRQLQIPVGLVVAGRQCWSQETATTAFGFAVTSADLETPQAAGRLPAHIAGPVPAGENRVLVTEADLLRAVTGMTADDLRSGDAVVFAPQADGSFRVLTRLTPDEWTALAGTARPQRRADAA